MKKVVFLLSTFLVAASLAMGQPQKTAEIKTGESGKERKAEKVALRKLEGNDVSSLSKNSFIQDFANVTDIHWKRSENFDEASFTNKDGKRLTAFYGIDGKLVGTTQDVKFSDVPPVGQKEILKKYKDYKIGNVVYFVDNSTNESDMVLWSAQFDDQDNYFVELTKGQNTIIVKVDTMGTLSFFKTLK
jgi:hypothetical protein